MAIQLEEIRELKKKKYRVVVEKERGQPRRTEAVSYTHLDVYKRQGLPKLYATNPIGKTYSCRCGNNFSQYFGELGCPSCKGASGKAVLGYGHRVITSGGKVLPKWYNLPPSPDRGNKRSRTFQGFADAMADQWG